jgi:hypothetical protein
VALVSQSVKSSSSGEEEEEILDHEIVFLEL